MRIVIFTGDAAIESSPWWPIVLSTRGLQAILVYRQRPRARRGAIRRFAANVRKHGALWIPYRVAYGLAGVASRLRQRTLPATGPAPVPVERLDSDSLAQADTLARVAAWRPDLGVALGAPILKPAVFTLPRLGTINLHQGKLPDFRGAPPGFWELATGASEIGATVHWVDAGLDTGRVLAAATAPLYPHDSLRTVEARGEELGRRVLAETLEHLARGPEAGTPQPPGGRTYRMPLLQQRLALAARLAGRGVARALAPRAVAKAASTLVALALWRPLRDLVRSARRRHPLRVFNFHRVTHLCRDGMTVAPDVFERQLRYIQRRHDMVTLEEALAMVRDGRRLRRPAALITFDDGYRCVFDTAFPAMRARGIPGCCFVPTALVGTSAALPHDLNSPVRGLLGLMTWEQLATLREAGWAVGAHSATHARLSEVSGEALVREVDGALDTLRRRLGEGCAAVAYPYGGRDDISEAARGRTRQAGYAACFNDEFGEIALPGTPYDLNRIDLGGDHGTLDWKRAVHGISLARWRW